MRHILIIAPYGFNDRMMNFIEFVSARLLARSDWRVSAVVGSDTGNASTETLFGVSVYRYGTRLQGLIQVIRLIAKRPSVVHVHNLRNNRVGVAGAMVAKILRIPLVCTEYGLLHDHYLVDDREDPLGKPLHPERVVRTFGQLLRRLPSGPRDALASYLFHWPLSHADVLAFVSRHNVPIASMLDLPPATYLPHLADDARWSDTEAGLPNASDTEIIRKIANLRGESALFVGQMKLRKGWDVLLRAIPHVPPDVIKIFVFVSSSTTKEHADFAALVEKLGIRDRVLFLGKVPRNSTLRKVYEATSLLIVPSRYEGFGLAPLDAFELKRPVVASNVEALTDYLINGENCILIPPKDSQALAGALIRVSQDASMREHIVNGGQTTLKELQSGAHGQKWLDFYTKLIGS